MAICVTFRWEIFAADKDTSYIDMRRGSKYGDSATETKPHVGALCIWYPCSLMNFIARRFRTRSGHIPIYSVSCRRDDVDGKVWRAVTILSLSLLLSSGRGAEFIWTAELSIGYDIEESNGRLVFFFRVSRSYAELLRTHEDRWPTRAVCDDKSRPISDFPRSLRLDFT